MISVDYTYSNLKLKHIKRKQNKILKIVENFENGMCVGKEYTGWKDFASRINKEKIDEIQKEAKKIQKNSNVFVVCGIGGSYLGARAVIEALRGYIKNNIEIMYIGNTFDERYTSDVLNYLKEKDFSINVISKSGSTLETAYAFRMLKDLLVSKYGEKSDERIYVTTDPENGCLREMANEHNWKTFDIPSNIGGRYSVITPVGLLPMAVANVDIEKFLQGVKKAEEDLKFQNIEKNIAYQYAAYRNIQYKKNKKIEIFSSYSPYLNMVAEWWKQLFGESEGKDGKGLFPSSVNFSTDLHSLGQFIQQGKKEFFITQLKIEGDDKLYLKEEDENKDNLNYLSKFSLNQINKKAQEGTNIAHHTLGNVDIFTFEVKKIDEINIGYLLYTLMYSCMISAYLLGVNPFNQPGVEFYKSEMKKLLKK